MTIEDLREQGVLLPEEEWDKHSLKTTVRKLPLAIALLVATASCVLMFLGDGGRLTWVGVAVFILTLYAVTWLLDRAVARQRERVRRESASGEP
jgi:hydrogenase-4 membrane subunit HyfE